MAELKLIKNGAPRKVSNKRRTKRRKRSNSAISKTAAKAPRRNGTTKAGAVSYARKNGLKLVSKSVANGKRRRKGKRRNGTITKTRSNGMFGNNRETVVSVVSLLVGLGLTKVESGILTPLAQQMLGMAGLGAFAKPIVEAGAAITVNRWAAEAVKKGSGKYVMYGGLAMALMSALEHFLPQSSAYNPFASANTTPLVLNQPNIVDARALAAAANAQGATMGRAMINRPRVPMGYVNPRPKFVY